MSKYRVFGETYGVGGGEFLLRRDDGAAALGGVECGLALDDRLAGSCGAATGAAADFGNFIPSSGSRHDCGLVWGGSVVVEGGWVCSRVMLWEADRCRVWIGGAVTFIGMGQQRSLGDLSGACWWKVVAGSEEVRSCGRAPCWVYEALWVIGVGRR